MMMTRCRQHRRCGICDPWSLCLSEGRAPQLLLALPRYFSLFISVYCTVYPSNTTTLVNLSHWFAAVTLCASLALTNIASFRKQQPPSAYHDALAAVCTTFNAADSDSERCMTNKVAELIGLCCKEWTIYVLLNT